MIGWLGALCFAFCAAPQAIECYKKGHAEGLSTTFLLLWTVGEILTLIAIVQDAPLGYLLLNYGLNLLFLTVIWYYKLRPQ